ncbi:MAG TPA: hypothetical protein VGV63_11555 [Acidimicrobiales bacterium]|nr:hypothetical protein [Acidimicrobiales bacterium]
MTPVTGAGRFEHDPEAPEADAFEQSAAVGNEDDDEDGVEEGRATWRPDRDVEAPEADALEQSELAPLDDDDRR